MTIESGGGSMSGFDHRSHLSAVWLVLGVCSLLGTGISSAQPVGGQVPAPSNHLELVDKLPRELLGRWVKPGSDGSVQLLVRGSELIQRSQDPTLKEPRYFVHPYRVLGRSGTKYVMVIGTQEGMSTLEMNEERLELTTSLEPETAQAALEKAYSSQDREHKRRWVRTSPPNDHASWIDRAEWSIDQALERPELLEAAQLVLRLAHWPFQRVEVLDGYAVRYGYSMSLVIPHLVGDEQRQWSSMVGPGGEVSISNNSVLAGLGPRQLSMRWSDVGVSPLLERWVKLQILPLLPRK